MLNRTNPDLIFVDLGLF